MRRRISSTLDPVALGRRGRPAYPYARAIGEGDMKAAAVMTGLAALMLVAMCQKTPTSSVAHAASADVAQPAQPALPDDERATVSAAHAQCRTRPSPKAASVVRLARGARLEVLDRRDGWIRVSPTGDDCWVAEAQLDGGGTAGVAPSAHYAPRTVHTAPVRRRSTTPRRRSSAVSYRDGSCPCGSGNICIGPRGGRYCITSGGNKRYGL